MGLGPVVDSAARSDILVMQGRRFSVSDGVVRVVKLHNEWVDEIADPVAVVEEARQRNLPVDLLSFVERPPITGPRLPYTFEWENLAVLEISTYEHWLKFQIHENTRKKVRRAERCGVVVREELYGGELIKGLVDLFNEVSIRQGRVFAYFGWDVNKVTRSWGTELDRSIWLVARYQEELIGFIKLTVSDRIARASGTLAKVAHRDKATMNALIAKAVETCASRGIPMLVYGHFTYGSKGEDSLTAFKRRSGFRRVDIPRYYIPLSLRGRIALHLGLHRGLKRLIPGAVLRPLLRIRTRLYARGTSNIGLRG